MAFTHTLTYTYGSNGDYQQVTVSNEVESEFKADYAIAASADQQVTFALDFSKCKGLWISADQNMYLETNSSSAPDDTFDVTSTSPVAWAYVSGGSACPVTVDVTTLYVSATTAGTLKIRAAVDQT